VTHDVTLIRRDGSVHSYRVYDRSPPKEGDIITLPINGQLTKARVSATPGKAEMAQLADAEAAEI
jgi:hypothetical protein